MLNRLTNTLYLYIYLDVIGREVSGASWDGTGLVGVCSEVGTGNGGTLDQILTLPTSST